MTEFQVVCSGPRALAATDRRHHRLTLTVTAAATLAPGAELRTVLSGFRSLRDDSSVQQWQLSGVTAAAGRLEIRQRPPSAFNEYAGVRIAELHNHFVLVAVRVVEAVPAGQAIYFELAALLSHQAPMSARLLVQARLADHEAFVQAGEAIALTSVPGDAVALQVRCAAFVDDLEAIPMSCFRADALGNVVDQPAPDGLEIGRQTATPAEPVRITVRDAQTGFFAVGNPVLTRASLPAVYFGDIHFHCRYSGDGDRDLEAAYSYARDVLQLAVAAVTDHTPRQFWQETLAINEAFNEPHRFVTIPAWEWSTSTGHSNVYLRTPEVPAGPGRAATADHPGNAEWPSDAVVVPHHTNIRSAERKADGTHYWHEFNWSLPNRRVRAVEVVQGRGNFEADVLDAEWGIVTGDIGASVRDALRQGYRLGFVGGTDNHSGFPSRHATIGGGYIGLTGFAAEVLTREAIWQALDARRTYATSGVPIVCDFSINGLAFGSEGRLAEDRVRFAARLHGTGPIMLVQIISNDQVVWEDRPGAADVIYTAEALPPPADGSAYYYLRLRQADGHRAWLSPIWLDRCR